MFIESKFCFFTLKSEFLIPSRSFLTTVIIEKSNIYNSRYLTIFFRLFTLILLSKIEFSPILFLYFDCIKITLSSKNKFVPPNIFLKEYMLC